MIGWGVWSSYNIFTAKKPAPEIFKVNQNEVAKTSTQKNLNVQEQMQQQIQSALGDQISKMMPPDMLPKILNLAGWSLFMAILFLAAGKVSSIGIQLIKGEKPEKSK